MKFINYMIFAALISVVGCENDPGIEASQETFLPKLELKGSKMVTLPCGSSTYTDAGIDASENGEPVDVVTTVVGKYFGATTVSSPDIYDISYVAVNVDGIPGAVTRTVFAPPCNGDLVTNLEGLYTSTIFRNKVSSAAYTNVKYILIRKVGDTYQISDVIGGWYEFGRGLGTSYAALGGTFKANNIATNDFTFGPPVEVGGFGGTAVITDIKVDAAAKQIVVTATWSMGFEFVSTLTQVQ